MASRATSWRGSSPSGSSSTATGAVWRTSRRSSPPGTAIGPLHDELHLALDRRVEPSPLHAWLAALPPLLRERGLPQQLIVSTGFDTGVERAFEAAGEELDVVAYVAAGRDRGKFLHLAPDGAATVVDEPNAYTGLALERADRPAEDPRPRRPRRHTRAGELRRQRGRPHRLPRRAEPAGRCRSQLAARLRRSHLLFLGYAVDDWSLRVFLRRVWGGDRLAYRSWAVQPAADARRRASSGASAGPRCTRSRSTTYVGGALAADLGARGWTQRDAASVTVQGARVLRRLRARPALLLRPRARIGARRREPDGVAAHGALRA